MNNQPSYRIIFHIDMNAFFASCAVAQNRHYENKPIVIAHNDVFRKSIILTASYEARRFGIKATMMVRDAIKLCPSLQIVEPDYELYQRYSQLFFKYLYSITHKIEITSIDEGYMDVTELCQSISAIDLAKKIQNELYQIHHLPSSIGIAPNKFLAKMASDMKKPMGITILRKREIETLLWPLPISSMFGVGKKTHPKLESIGISTIKDCAQYKDKPLLIKTVGPSMADYLIERANGNDNSEVNYQAVDEIASISHSHTFSYNILNVKHIKDTLKVLSNTISNRLLTQQLVAQTIGIQIKYGNFMSINRSRGLDKPISDSLELWNVVEELFDDYYDEQFDVRLVGVFATRLTESKQKVRQYSIFDDMDQVSKENQRDQLLKQIKNQFGNDSIKVGFYEYKNKGESK